MEKSAKNPPICFRPWPEIRTALERYVDRNDVDNVSKLINYALAEQLGVKVNPFEKNK
jgi:Holliday junction resolvase RusA-like endonuclease